jgi:PTH1 family peptidyl-tRNA hydrolase
MSRRIIVGLGNPGAQYRTTRHNVGWLVLDRLMAAYPPQRSLRKFDAEVFEVRPAAGGPWLLLKPLTYMNLSGKSVAAAVSFYDLPLDHLMVVCDDLNLPLGRLRLRRDGSHGGQKGLADIIRLLGTNEFPRLRLGIGASERDAIDHVLGTFRPDEQSTVNDAIGRAASAVELWATDGLEAAMNRFNVAPAPPSADPPTPTEPGV